MTALHDLTATEALERMSRAQLSPVTYVDALLERIELREPTIQAWVQIDCEGALDAAKAAERAWQEGRGGPLCGIPVAVKDIIFTERMPTAGNFAPFEHHNPGFDATCIARLREAGAIILGKVTTTQFAGRDPTRTRNPWHLNHTASGSSSGSAAAVSDRMVPMALGTQTGGSVIRPAGYMGVVGFTPTYGRISRYGMFPRSFSFDIIGAMSRTLADAALLVHVMSGPDPNDRTTLRRGRLKDAGSADPRPPRLLLLEDFFEHATPDVAAHVARSVETLRTAGARVRSARIPVSLDTLLAVHTTILISEAATTQAHLLPIYRKQYHPGLRAQLETGTAIPASAYIHAQQLRRRIRRQFEPLLRGIDALVLPSTSEVAPDRSTIGPRTFQTPWTVLGWPSISLPAGLGEVKLPIGLQLVGAPFRETQLLSAARWSEQVLGSQPSPPDLE